MICSIGNEKSSNRHDLQRRVNIRGEQFGTCLRMTAILGINVSIPAPLPSLSTAKWSLR